MSEQKSLHKRSNFCHVFTVILYNESASLTVHFYHAAYDKWGTVHKQNWRTLYLFLQ